MRKRNNGDPVHRRGFHIIMEHGIATVQDCNISNNSLEAIPQGGWQICQRDSRVFHERHENNDEGSDKVSDLERSGRDRKKWLRFFAKEGRDGPVFLPFKV